MSKSFLIKDGNQIKSTTDGKILNSVGTDSFTNSLFDTYGMIDLNLFTPTVRNLINNNKYNLGMILNHDIYGFDIDESISDPFQAVTYVEDSKNFNPISVDSSGNVNYGSWKDTFLLKENKPCLLKNGVRNYYLNPDDYTKKEDGTSSDITSGDDGDVMSEFKQTWYKFEKNGDIISFRISDHQVDDSYCSNAFISESDYTSLKQYMYIGCYNGISKNSKLRSLSGANPTVNTTLPQFRTLATANGIGYQQLTFSKYQYIAALLVLMCKSINVQSKLGNGRVNTSSVIASGTLNNKGQFFGNFDNITSIKAFHIENIYGNVWQCLDGLGLSSYNYKYKNIGPYNDSYSDYNSGGTSTTNGYIKSMYSDNNIGLLPALIGGTSSSYYSDNLYVGNSLRVCFVGGNCNNGLYAGPFNFRLNDTASYTNSSVGSRLTFS